MYNMYNIHILYTYMYGYVTMIHCVYDINELLLY